MEIFFIETSAKTGHNIHELFKMVAVETSKDVKSKAHFRAILEQPSPTWVTLILVGCFWSDSESSQGDRFASAVSSLFESKKPAGKLILETEIAKACSAGRVDVVAHLLRVRFAAGVF